MQFPSKSRIYFMKTVCSPSRISEMAGEAILCKQTTSHQIEVRPFTVLTSPSLRRRDSEASPGRRPRRPKSTFGCSHVEQARQLSQSSANFHRHLFLLHSPALEPRRHGTVEQLHAAYDELQRPYNIRGLVQRYIHPYLPYNLRYRD